MEARQSDIFGVITVPLLSGIDDTARRCMLYSEHKRDEAEYDGHYERQRSMTRPNTTADAKRTECTKELITGVKRYDNSHERRHGGWPTWRSGATR